MSNKTDDEPSLVEYMAALAKRATDLEHRLVAVTKEVAANRSHNHHANDRAIHQYRTQLCEVLSDWLLTDPATAETNDVAGRLWRHCFYARIGPDRARISKEKKRQQQARVAMDGVPASTTAAAVHGLVKMQESLHVFLGEGIMLYEYVCQRMQVALLKLTTTRLGESDPAMESDTHETKIVSVEGIVPCLNRLYNCWGDLYRYGDHFTKADWAYSMAARLGPGSGHAYNQLAVVSQIKHGNSNQSQAAAVTVYWYSRSLGAVKEPFPTALSNLRRLWTSNAEWLAEQREKQSSTTVVLAGNASRLFLSQLVNLQFNLLETSSETGIASSDRETVLYNDLREASLAFRELLNSSAIGDSLLAKLVAVAAFTEFYSQRHGQNQIPLNESVKNWTATRLLTLELGLRMAERVQLTLETKLKPGQTVIPSVRVLFPLVLLVEYLLHTPGSDVSNLASSSDHHISSSKAFWTSVTKVHNLLQPLQSELGTVDPTIVPKEYHEFRGFSPFEPFLKDDNVTESGYLTPAAAARERYSYPNADKTVASQESLRLNSQASGGVAAGADDSVHVVKVQRLLGLRPKLLAFKTQGCRIREQNGVLELVNVVEVPISDDDMLDDFNDNAPVMMDDEPQRSDKAAFASDTNSHAAMNDVLVYKSNETGGPALLMPGALLLDHHPVLDPNLNRAAAVNGFSSGNCVPHATPTLMSVEHPANGVSLVAPQIPLNLESLLTSREAADAETTGQVGFVVLPPPGFSSRLEATTDPLAMLLRGDVSTEAHLSPSFYMNLGLSDISSGLSRGPTIGESLDLFGGPSALQTANPFATEQVPTFDMGSYMFPQSDAAFLNQDSAGLDGTSLIDSSLLSSLLMDDGPQKSSTRNPFAT